MSQGPNEYPPRGYELVIRAMNAESDWSAVYAMREEPAVRHNILALPFTDPMRFRERVLVSNSTSTRLVAEVRFPAGASRIVGMLGLHRKPAPDSAHCAELGINVATEFQGQGIGSALMEAMCMLCDSWLNLHRVELEVFTDNSRAIALYQRFGFLVEATMKRYAYRDGGFVDAHKMGRLNPHHKELSATQ